MPGTEIIIGAFALPGEGGQTVLFADRQQRLSSAGEYFVRVALVAYIPYQMVLRGIQAVMQGYCQFNNPQSGTKVSPCLADTVEQKMPQFPG